MPRNNDIHDGVSTAELVWGGFSFVLVRYLCIRLVIEGFGEVAGKASNLGNGTGR